MRIAWQDAHHHGFYLIPTARLSSAAAPIALKIDWAYLVASNNSHQYIPDVHGEFNNLKFDARI